MKNILLLTLLLIISTSVYLSAQPRYEIRGNITAAKNNTKIRLFSWSREVMIDSAYIINGKFLLTGKVSEVPERLSIQIQDGKTKIERHLLIGNEKISVTGNISSPEGFQITGSPYQDGQNKLEAYSASYKRQMDGLSNADYEKNRIEIRKIRDIIDARTMVFIKNNLNLYASVIQLSNYKSYMPKDTLRACYSKIPVKLKSSSYGKMIAGYLDQLSMGDAAYDFSALAQNGKTVKFSEARKRKPVLLLFGAAWCQPCVASVPELKEIYKSKPGLQIVSYSNDSEKKAWLSSLKREGVEWLSLWTGKGNYSDAFIKYGFTGLPSYVLINAQGVVIDKGTGYSEGKYFKVVEKLK